MILNMKLHFFQYDAIIYRNIFGDEHGDISVTNRVSFLLGRSMVLTNPVGHFVVTSRLSTCCYPCGVGVVPCTATEPAEEAD